MGKKKKGKKSDDPKPIDWKGMFISNLNAIVIALISTVIAVFLNILVRQEGVK